MTVKVGINGFGRIGRNVLRAAVQNFGADIEIVAINDLLEPDYLAYMLAYDSVHGRFKGEIAIEGGALIVNCKKIRLTQERDPSNLKWGEVGAEVVIESTGLFLDKVTAQKHLDAGANARQHADSQCLRIQHGARAQHDLVSKFIGELFKRFHCAWHGHGDFGRANAARVDRFDGQDGAFGGRGAHDGHHSDLENGG